MPVVRDVGWTSRAGPTVPTGWPKAAEVLRVLGAEPVRERFAPLGHAVDNPLGPAHVVAFRVDTATPSKLRPPELASPFAHHASRISVGNAPKIQALLTDPWV